MFGNRRMSTVLCLAAILGFFAAGAMGANILFITSFDEVMMPGDNALRAYIEGLGHTVTYFDDDETEAATEAAAATADLVFISESVGSAKVRLEITEVEKPIVILEAWAYDEMGLTLGTGEGLAVVSTDIEIVAPQHPLAAGFSGTVTVLTSLTGRLEARFATGRATEDATVVARATLNDGVTYDVIWVYEKGARLAVPPADGSEQKAADIRVCFGFDEQSYLAWNDNAYALLQAAINFGLGIRIQPEAYSPSPADTEIDVQRDVVLGWKAGIYADTHNVYFGTDFNDVSEAGIADPRGVLVSQNQEGTTYDPPGDLAYGQTYYWRIDEVNAAPDATIYKGPVWSFTALNFLLVEDFENYTDEDGSRIYQTWLDGYGTTDNGSQVGYAEAPFAEQFIVHGGEQSMPFFYNTDMKYSEATMALSGEAADWTRDGVESLSLWLRGYPAYLGGFTALSASAFEVTGAGTDIWDNIDECHFAFKEINGSTTIIARVDSLEVTDPFAKAGLMIRDALDSGSRNVCIVVTPENGIRFQYRLTNKGGTDRQFVEAITAPYWLRLERTSGGLVRAYHSANGITWTQFTLQTITMTQPVYVGLVVTSHSPGVPCKGAFSSVTMTGTGSDGAWSDQDIGLISNAPERTYVVLNDQAVVYHDDPSITVNESWSQWIVPLQAFASQGVNLAAVNKLGVGVGTRGNTTTAGTSGQMYFDDIRLYRPAP